jgi:NDP-sugar pyrophosphorylase family protein
MPALTGVHGVLLAGSYHWAESSLDELVPRPLLPVVQKPLISYPLRWLRDGGVNRITICANSVGRSLRRVLGTGERISMTLDYYEDWTPRGTAGCVRDSGIPRDAEILVVARATTIPAVDLGAMLKRHVTEGALVTVSAHRGASVGPLPRPLRPSGIYIFDRRALDYVPETGFQDIKEGLIPRLYRSREKVVVYESPEGCAPVLNPETYLLVNQWLIERLGGERPWEAEEFVRYGDALVSQSARIGKGVRMIGPSIVGAEAVISDEAMVVGPTTLGAGSQVGEGALVSRSVGWQGCSIGAGAVVDRCVLTTQAVVERGEQAHNVVKLGRPQLSEGAAGAGSARPLAFGLPSLPRPVGSAQAAAS